MREYLVLFTLPKSSRLDTSMFDNIKIYANNVKEARKFAISTIRTWMKQHNMSGKISNMQIYDQGLVRNESDDDFFSDNNF